MTRENTRGLGVQTTETKPVAFDVRGPLPFEM